ncbi:Ig-like domain-containing protein, partial [Lacticaseibacillus hulanensis]|uniref:Ig-like domain-containing protein n=1 Tax=Lacticaseibacillus hulanensis TaxID=2493111 RepID=UPI001F4ED8BF
MNDDGTFKTDIPESDLGPGKDAKVVENGKGGPSDPATVTAPVHEPEVTVGEAENGEVPVSGEAEPGATVTITPEKGDPVTTTADDQGKFNTTIPEEDAPEGSDVKVKQEIPDAAPSGETTKQVPFHTPDAPTLTPSAPDKDGNITVTGKAEPDADITLTTESGKKVTGKADDKGDYKVTVPESDAPEGSELTAIQTKNGVDSPEETADVPFAKPDQPSDVQLTPNEDGSTTITGKGDPEDTVTITPEGGEPITVPISDDGTFKTKIPGSDLPDGKPVTITEDGKGGSSDPLTEKAPLHKPTATVGEPTNGTVPVSGTAAPGATVTVTPENGDPVTATADDQGKFKTTIPEEDAPEGSDVKVKQEIPGSTPSGETTEQVPFHTPDAPTLTPSAPDKDGNITVTGKAEPDADITLTTESGKKVTGKADDKGDYKVNVPESDAPEGSKLTAIQTKNGVDSPEETADVPYAKPDQPSDVQLTPNDDGSTTITGKGDPEDTVTITPDGGEPITVPISDDGTFKAKVPGDELPDGAPVTITEDGKGGSSDPLTEKAPLHKPTATVGEPTNGTVPVSGTAVPGATVTVTPEKGDPVTATADDQGKYTAEVPEEDAPEGSKLQVTQKTDGPESPATTAEVPVHTPDAPTVTPAAPGADGKVHVTGTGEPGATVTVKPENGNGVSAPVTEDGTYSLDIPEEDAPEGTKVTATQMKNGKDSPAEEATVPYAKPDKPTVKAEETPGGTKISGTGDPEDVVTITPEDGGTPITVPIKDDGTFSVTVPEDELKPGSQPTVTEDGKGGSSDPVQLNVPYQTPDAPTVKAGAPADGKVPVSGTAEPGAEVTITPENGDPVTATADENGAFTTDVPEASAPEGSKLNVTQKNHDKTSDPATATVPYAKPDKPTVKAEETPGGTKISGTGDPEDVVTITPEDGGTPITVPIKDDGTFSVTVPEDDLKPGSTPTVTEDGKGGSSDPVKLDVPFQTPDAPTVKAGTPADGKVPVSGTAEPGAEVTITPETGDPVTVTADENGAFTADVPEENAPEGSKLNVTQKNNDKTSKPATVDVPYARPVAKTPTVADPANGTVEVTGTGKPGDTITITPEKGGQVVVPVADDGTYTADVPLSWAPYGSDITAVENGKGGSSDPVTAKVPAMKLTAPTGTATVPVNGQVTVTGKAAAGATVTLITQDDKTFTATADDKGAFTIEIPSTSAKIGSDIKVTQTLNGSTSPEGKITVPHREALKAPTVTAIVGSPAFGFDDGAQKTDPRLRSLADHTISMSGSIPPMTVSHGETYTNPRIRIYADKEMTQLILEHPVDESFVYKIEAPLSEFVQGSTVYVSLFWHVELPDGVLMDPATPQDENGDVHSTPDAYTVPFYEPDAPKIYEENITNDGSVIKISGLGDMGTLVTVSGGTSGDISVTASPDDQTFKFMLPAEYAAPGTQLKIAEVNGDKTGAPTTITVPEPTTKDDGSETTPTDNGGATTPDDDKAKLDDEIKKLTDQVDELKNQLGDATSTIGNKDDEIAKLNGDIDDLKTQLGDATSTAQDTKDELDKLKTDITDLQTQLGDATKTAGDKDGEISKLTDQINQLKTQLDNATATNGATDEDISKLNDEITDLKNRLGDATKTAGDKDGEISKLTDQINQLKTQLDNATSTSGATDEDISKLTDEITDLKNQLGDATKTAGDKDGEIGKLTDQINQLKKQLDNATATNGATDEDISKLNDEITDLKTQLGDATKTAGDKDGEISKLNDQINQLKTQLDDATSTKATTDDEISKLNDQITDLKTQLDDATSTKAATSDDI